MDEPEYLSFLLRLWPVTQEGRTIWRASLESSQTGERFGFSDIEALFYFIEHSLSSPAALKPLLSTELVAHRVEAARLDEQQSDEEINE
jgi:hypothetical protein